MSTRGAIGIRFNGTDKVAYNHYDSYPTGLGQELLNWLKCKTIYDIECEFDSISFADVHISTPFDDGFVSEFRDAVEFLYDSLFCEYAYIINLDTKTLEFYKGFNRNKDAKGRYANCSNPCKLSDGSYMYGVELVKEFPLDELFTGKWKTDEDADFVEA